LTRVLRGLAAIVVGTRDESLVPACTSGVGFSYDAGTNRLTVFIPEATGGETFANLAHNGSLAVVLEEISTHRTVQIKGRAVENRPAIETERTIVENCMNGFFYQVEVVGMNRESVRRKNRWPCRAVTMDILDVFEQTPGPEAGRPLTASGIR
jgi:hypothetical protein